jgi:hypothetical protein
MNFASMALIAASLSCSLASQPVSAQKKHGGTMDSGDNAADRSPPKSSPRKTELQHGFFWAAPDALRGDWQGTGDLVAQVVPVADRLFSVQDSIPSQEDNGKYEAHLFKAFAQPNDKPVAILLGDLAGGVLTLTGDGWTGTIQNGHFKAHNLTQSIDLEPATRTPPTLGMKPPPGAVVLFDGTNMDQWAKMKEREWLIPDGPSPWHLLPGGVMESVPRKGNLISKKTFGDAYIHVEFRNLGGPTNSGVYIQDRYEANINEVYGSLDANPNGQFDNASAIKPGIRASRPPLEWQTMDIDFKAPRFGPDGKRTAPPRVTLLLNGIVLYKDQDLGPVILNAARLGEATTGPIQLQEHGMPVQFRNIWLTEPAK